MNKYILYVHDAGIKPDTLKSQIFFLDELWFHNPTVFFCFVYSNGSTIGKVQVDALFLYKSLAILNVYFKLWRYTV